MSKQTVKAEQKLKEIRTLMKKDMTCCFCDSWLYSEILKIVDPKEYRAIHEPRYLH